MKFDPLINISKQKAEKKYLKYVFSNSLSNNKKLVSLIFMSNIKTKKIIIEDWISNLNLGEDKKFISEANPTQKIKKINKDKKKL